MTSSPKVGLTAAHHHLETLGQIWPVCHSQNSTVLTRLLLLQLTSLASRVVGAARTLETSPVITGTRSFCWSCSSHSRAPAAPITAERANQKCSGRNYRAGDFDDRTKTDAQGPRRRQRTTRTAADFMWTTDANDKRGLISGEFDTMGDSSSSVANIIRGIPILNRKDTQEFFARGQTRPKSFCHCAARIFST